MKHFRFLLLLTFALAHHSSCLAQFEWFPIGAEWFYTLRSSSSANERFLTTRISGDTIVAGQEGRIFSGERGGLVYSENKDKVYKYDEGLEKWFLLYDFTAQAGDTLSIHFSDSAFFEIVIDSISTIEIEGETFDVQYFSQTFKGETFVEWGNRNIRYLGNDLYFFPQSPFIDPPFGPLRCYSTISQPVYSIVPFACDLVSTKEQRTVLDNIFIYPNPTSDYLIINGISKETNEYYFKLHDLQGKLLKTTLLTEKKINVKGLLSGIYIISIYSKTKKIFTQFFSKN